MDNKQKKSLSGVTAENIKALSTKGDFLNFLFIWIILISAPPFTLSLAIPGYPNKVIIAAGLSASLFLTFIRRKFSSPNKAIIFILFTQVIFFSSFSFFHSRVSQSGYTNLSILYLTILLFYIYVHNSYSMPKMAKSFIYMIVLMGIMGAIAFCLGVVGGIDVVSTHENTDTRTAYNFLLTFSNQVDFSNGSLIMRVAGFFDEPGTFAYHIYLAILVNKIYGFSKKFEWILICVGLFTLSMAFYITIFVYLLLLYGSLKQLKYFLLISILLGSLGFYINIARYDSPVNSTLYKLTIARFMPDPEEAQPGSLVAGNNRAELFPRAWEAFNESPLIGQGMNSRIDPKSNYYGVLLGANLLAPLALHGLIGAPFPFLIYFYWTFLVFKCSRYRNFRILLSCWLIVSLNFLQRPVIDGFLTYFVFIFLIEATRYRVQSYRKANNFSFQKGLATGV